jgi:hypothetical protein
MSAIGTLATPDRALGDVIAPVQRSTETAPRTSPRVMARWGGALFLATIVGGIVAQGVLSDRLVVARDAAATARNIAANQNVVRAAFAIFMIEMACQIATTAVMAELLMPVDRSLARAAAAFGYIGSGIKIVSRLFFYAPLFVLGGSSSLSAFSPSQLDAIAYLLIRINNHGAGTACIFFGVNTVMVGSLMLRASFLPRVLGVLSVIGAAGWLAFLYPPLGSRLFVPIALCALIGCAVTIGWLLIRGVDEKRWYETAAASASSPWR